MKTTFVSTVLVVVVSTLGIVTATTTSAEPGLHRELRRGPPSCERLVAGDATKGAQAATVMTFIEGELAAGGLLVGNAVAQTAYDRMTKKRDFIRCMIDQCAADSSLESPNRDECREDDDEDRQRLRGLRRRGGGGEFFGPPRGEGGGGGGGGDDFDCEDDMDDALDFVEVVEGEFGANGGDNRAARMIVLKVEMRMLRCD